MIIQSWIPAAVSIISAIYIYGRLAERVSGHSRWLRKLDTNDDKQNRAIARIEGHLGIGSMND